MELHEFSDRLFTAYKSGYYYPRELHYRQIAEKWNTDGLAETDALADTYDLGCRHTQNDHPRFDKDELLKEIASW